MTKKNQTTKKAISTSSKDTKSTKVSKSAKNISKITKQAPKKNKETTISLQFRTLRSVYNKAIESKCARKSDYPFNEYKIQKTFF